MTVYNNLDEYTVIDEFVIATLDDIYDQFDVDIYDIYRKVDSAQDVIQKYNDVTGYYIQNLHSIPANFLKQYREDFAELDYIIHCVLEYKNRDYIYDFNGSIFTVKHVEF